jgi:UV DNA damage repair endonuclease
MKNVNRIGFACKYFHPDRSLKAKQLKELERPLTEAMTTVAWLNRQTREVAEQKLWEIMEHNTRACINLINYVGNLPDELRMVRLGSNQLPMYTEPTWSYFWKLPDVQQFCEKAFADVGSAARRQDVRLSFHPGQFCVLASDSDDIVERSIEEFEYHADMARWMGYGRTFQDFKCNVHISGRRGPEGIKETLKRLSPEARNIITIENDENAWGVDHSLQLVNHCALVLDIHHHWCREGDYIHPTDDRYKRMMDSWRGVRPVIHYSVSRDDYLADHDPFTKPDKNKLIAAGYRKGKLRAHSDYFWNKAVNDHAWSFKDYADIMCEAKAKQCASIGFYNEMTGKNVAMHNNLLNNVA